MEAILYLRFSTLEQREGASIDRQLERCTAMADANGWTIGRTLIDEGKSAFHGAHREVGSAFGDFEREAMAGIHAGKVLIIERLSRLSRADYNATYSLILALTSVGRLTVACWDGSKIYEAGKPPRFEDVIELLVKAKLANEESVVKVDFSKDKWKRRRAAAAKGVIATKTGPAWLRLSADRSEWIELDDRVTLVRRMFEMADSGDGALVIARKLNDEQVAPWPRYKNRTPTLWDRKFISRIIKNPAVIGDWVPGIEDEGGVAQPAEPIRGYYPRIIEPDLFERVNAGAAGRKAVRGRTSSAVVNLVSGLATCSECGGKMDYFRSRKAGAVIVKKGVAQAPLKSDQGTLYCRLAMASGTVCTNRAGIAYLGFERALLDAVLHYALDDQSFSRTDEVGRLSILLADRRRDADAATDRAKSYWEGYAATKSAMAMRMATDEEKAAKAITDEIETLENARRKASGEASAAEHLSRLADLRANLYCDDMDLRRTHRSKVAAGLRTSIQSIICRPSKLVEVTMIGDSRYIRIAPGRGRRPASFTTLDLVHPTREYPDLTKGEAAVRRRVKEARTKG